MTIERMHADSGVETRDSDAARDEAPQAALRFEVLEQRIAPLVVISLIAILIGLLVPA